MAAAPVSPQLPPFWASLGTATPPAVGSPEERLRALSERIRAHSAWASKPGAGAAQADGHTSTAAQLLHAVAAELSLEHCTSGSSPAKASPAMPSGKRSHQASGEGSTEQPAHGAKRQRSVVASTAAQPSGTQPTDMAGSRGPHSAEAPSVLQADTQQRKRTRAEHIGSDAPAGQPAGPEHLSSKQRSKLADAWAGLRQKFQQKPKALSPTLPHPRVSPSSGV